MSTYTPEEFEADLKAAEGFSQAEADLKAGHPVSYRDERYPGKIIREYPDGHREFVWLDDDGNVIVVGSPDK